MFSIDTISYHVYYELYKQTSDYFGQFQGLINQVALFHPGTTIIPPIKLKAFRCKLTINEWLSQSNQTLEIGGVTQSPTIEKVVTLGRQDKGFYFLKQHWNVKQSVEDTQSSDAHLKKQTGDRGVACFSDVELWHYRLGHLSFEQLKYIDAYNCSNGRHHGIC